MSSSKKEWTQYREQYLQNRLQELREEVRSLYSFDSSNITVEVESLEVASTRHIDYRQEITFKRGGEVLILLETADLDDRESDRPFLDFLETIEGGFHMSIGVALRLNRFQFLAGPDESEIKAVTHLLVCCMDYADLLVAELALMEAQSPIFLEEWKRAYMFYPEKIVEFEGVRYLRSDHPASNHH